MSNLEKFLTMLQSEKASDRYEACEELRVATESNPEIVLALEKALNDENAGVAERARAALYSDLHQQMALKMGKIDLKKQKVKTQELISSTKKRGVFENGPLLKSTIEIIGVISTIYFLWLTQRITMGYDPYPIEASLWCLSGLVMLVYGPYKLGTYLSELVKKEKS